MTKLELVESKTLVGIMAELAALNKRLDGVDMVPKSQWLSILDYASKVGKSTDTVRRWIRGGLLETKTEGRTRLILFNPGV
jgi:hypothetical protein